MNTNTNKNVGMEAASEEPLEVEVKFYMPDIDETRNRILDLGAKSLGRVFETNIRYEDAGRTLIRNRSLLRLRRDDKAKLTFKSSPAVSDPKADSQFKIRKELEVEVGDFSTMKTILESLGFHEEQVYEKRRETLILENVIICLDEMPYGNFLELEGDRVEIPGLADRIGLKWEKRILGSYLGIFTIIKNDMNLPFSDITFDNFRDIDVDQGKYLHLLEAG